MSRTLTLRRTLTTLRRSLVGKANAGDVASLPRRRFIQQVLAGMSALSAADLVACSRTGPPHSAHVRRTTDARVVIVGAGLAGLSCAYRLAQAGVTAHVYEASMGVGGRTRSSARGQFPDAQVGELGGEFIDSNHAAMHALARELEIQLEDRRDALDALSARDFWWLSGQRIGEEALASQFEQAASIAAQQTRDAQRGSTSFDQLDRTSLADWLSTHVRGEALRTVLGIAYRGEYGTELEAQSALNLLLMLGASTDDGFHLFGDSDERFRARRGNQTFCLALASRLGEQLVLGYELTGIRGDANRGYTLQFRVGPERSQDVTAEIVVLALPFTTLRQVDMHSLDLSLDKAKLIRELGYGAHIKMLDAFRRRTWLEDYGASGSVGSDEEFQQFWDTSLAQAGRSGLLTTFLAGRAAEAAKADDWTQQVLLKSASRIFPGIERDHVAGRTLQIHWPSQPFARASYACYRPGQWSMSGQEGTPEQDGTLHFCGEHTSVDHQGFMEGAAESGTLVAGAVLEQLARPAHPVHAALLREKRLVSQPAFAEPAPAHTRPARRLHIERSLARHGRLV